MEVCSAQYCVAGHMGWCCDMGWALGVWVVVWLGEGGGGAGAHCSMISLRTMVLGLGTAQSLQLQVNLAILRPVKALTCLDHGYVTHNPEPFASHKIYTSHNCLSHNSEPCAGHSFNRPALYFPHCEALHSS